MIDFYFYFWEAELRSSKKPRKENEINKIHRVLSHFLFCFLLKCCYLSPPLRISRWFLCFCSIARTRKKFFVDWFLLQERSLVDRMNTLFHFFLDSFSIRTQQCTPSFDTKPLDCCCSVFSWGTHERKNSWTLLLQTFFLLVTNFSLFLLFLFYPRGKKKKGQFFSCRSCTLHTRNALTQEKKKRKQERKNDEGNKNRSLFL